MILMMTHSKVLCGYLAVDGEAGGAASVPSLGTAGPVKQRRITVTLHTKVGRRTH